MRWVWLGRNGLLLVALLGCTRAAQAATLNWKGHTWQLTSGGMAGACEGDPKNVSVDGNGYLHLKISHDGNTWSAAEMFTTDQLGFGTYQWQIDGPIDTFDPNVVLGLFPYGPQDNIGDDGTNEIDIEYSRWGDSGGPNGDWTNYPASGSAVGELSYSFSLGGSTLSTSRFVWTDTSITDYIFKGLIDVGTSSNFIRNWRYQPQNPSVNIPQQPLPLGMNLWCFQSPLSDGQPVEVVIRDFSFVPADGAAAGAGGQTESGDGGASAVGGDGDGGAADTQTNGGVENVGGSAKSLGGALSSSGGGGGVLANGGAALGFGGASSAGGAHSGGASSSAGKTSRVDEPVSSSGCSCRIGEQRMARAGESWLGLFAAVLLLRRRRR